MLTYPAGGSKDCCKTHAGLAVSRGSQPHGILQHCRDSQEGASCIRCDHVHNVVALDTKSCSANTDCRARRLLTHAGKCWQEIQHTVSCAQAQCLESAPGAGQRAGMARQQRWSPVLNQRRRGHHGVSGFLASVHEREENNTLCSQRLVRQSENKSYISSHAMALHVLYIHRNCFMKPKSMP